MHPRRPPTPTLGFLHWRASPRAPHRPIPLSPPPQVPYESLRRTARDRKQAVDALAAVAAELAAAAAAAGGGDGGDGAGVPAPSHEAAAALMTDAAARLAKLKRKVRGREREGCVWAVGVCACVRVGAWGQCPHISHCPHTCPHSRPHLEPPRASPHHSQLDAASASEAADAARCVARLHHLLDAGGAQPPPGGGKAGARDAGSGAGARGTPGEPGRHPPSPPVDLASAPPPPATTDPATSSIAWAGARADRLIADDLLRRGRPGAAVALRGEADAGRLPGAPDALAALVDWGIWEGAAPALAGLAARDATPALAWCAAHDARLAKLRSPLEFRLRLQQCVEAVRGGDALGALAAARAHLAPWAVTGGRGGAAAPACLADLQRVAGLAAFAGRGGLAGAAAAGTAGTAAAGVAGAARPRARTPPRRPCPPPTPTCWRTPGGRTRRPPCAGTCAAWRARRWGGPHWRLSSKQGWPRSSPRPARRRRPPGTTPSPRPARWRRWRPPYPTPSACTPAWFAACLGG